ncbi:8-amino-7-oxononanoate synthase [Xylophilus rhododendri]|uniref:8-amino-7-oxononanoate synthase n=1 Tax=Xylophilus rhododendri TaxID=2697032 RepID=A0A857J096_9BURK|nr:8-amino-7-oxononanoate synthase [Xylophilus rhododendri]QHI96531.1 8-amino-7-oxononanoate synthase [Xylophilus rhododendri]
MLIEHLTRQLHEREAQFLRRRRRVAETACAPQQRLTIDGGRPREMLGFCSNDYLGLANHPELIAAMGEGAALYGAGSGASHLVSGHSRAHADVEQALAATQSATIPGCEALFFCTGFMANMALLTALGDAKAMLFSDKLNHASLIDGSRLAKAKVLTYPHKRMDLLDALLESSDSPIKIIVTDAVFSMDGDIAPMDKLLALADKHDAYIVVDDAHGFGVLGPQGRGTLAHFGLSSQRFILMGTLGKALGVAGAFVAAHPTVIAWLVQSARAYIYTTAAPPAVAHAVGVSLKLVMGEEGDRRRAHLATLGRSLHESLAGIVEALALTEWSAPDSQTPIHPFIVGDNKNALSLAAQLDTQGLWVPAIRPPTVPAGTARLRITLSASHTEADVWRLCSVLADAAESMLP